MPTTYPDPLGPVPRIRVGGKPEQIGTFASTGFQFRRLPVRSTVRSGSAHSGQMDHPSTEATFHKKSDNLFGQAVHVSHRAPYGNRETGMGRSPPHETHSVASEATLACPREFGKSYSNSPLPPLTSRLVAGRGQYSQGSALAPPSTRSADIYRRLKRRLGRTLRGVHGKRHLVRTRKLSPHQFLGVKSSLTGPQEFRASLQGSDCSDSNGQHNCNLLHQEGRRYEIRLSLCPTLETPVLVSSQKDSFAGKTHPRSLECHSGQTVQTQSSDTDRVVPVSTGFPSLVFKMGPTSNRSFCNSIQSQASQVCITGSGSGSLGSGCSQSFMGKSGCVCLPSSLPSQSSRVKASGSGLSQDDPGRPRVAQHALVLGSGQSVESDSFQSSLGEGPVNPAIQRSPPQEPESSQSACLAPRASSIQKQGFSDEVAARIEAPQRSSTRAVYKSKWAIFVKWCESNEVDFRSPSLKQVADFFKERHLQPSTIEGYRTAIADMISNDKIQFGKDENLTRLLDSFHRDKGETGSSCVEPILSSPSVDKSSL